MLLHRALQCRGSQSSTSAVSDCLEYDDFFDAVTVLTDHKTKS
jgi:hypothetical protein